MDITPQSAVSSAALNKKSNVTSPRSIPGSGSFPSVPPTIPTVKSSGTNRGQNNAATIKKIAPPPLPKTGGGDPVAGASTSLPSPPATDAESSGLKKVTVEIFGTPYRLKTDGDPDILHRCAKMVDERMRRASTRSRTFSDPKLGVLVALEIADEYFRLKKDYDELVAMLADK